MPKLLPTIVCPRGSCKSILTTLYTRPKKNGRSSQSFVPLRGTGLCQEHGIIEYDRGE